MEATRLSSPPPEGRPLRGPPFPNLDDPEGDALPPGIRVTDAHVHLFPPRTFRAIWRWFETHAWRVRYQLEAPDVLEFLLSRGVERVVGLCYGHLPGMSRDLNLAMADWARGEPALVPLGTVLPGEPGAVEVVREALGPLGLRGLKLHAHVQGVAPDDPRLDPIYVEAVAARVPVVFHAGRAPMCAGYRCDPDLICGPDRVQNVLQRHPELRFVVPHLGADHYEGFEALLDRFEHLYLDTTMAIGSYLKPEPDLGILARRSERLLYGTDFPNLPFAWDRELRVILDADLEPAAQEAILSGTAAKLFGIA